MWNIFISGFHACNISHGLVYGPEEMSLCKTFSEQKYFVELALCKFRTFNDLFGIIR